MKRPILLLALTLLLFAIPSFVSASAAVKLSRADSIWQSIGQTPSVATSAMSSTQMQMSRPLRYSVDTAIFKIKFSDTATVDSVGLVFITHKKKSVIKAARAALVPLRLTVKPDQIDQWVYHRMFCFHLRGQNDKWFEHNADWPDKSDTIDFPFGLMKEDVPKLPLGLADADTTRSVGVTILVDERGQSRLAIVTRPSGDTFLDDHALFAAINSKYRPPEIPGKSPAIWASHQVRFSLR